MAVKFTKVIVIFNPNSTGESEKNAREFIKDLHKASFPGEVSLVGTKYAGHAEEIAASHTNKQTLIVSSSGDGGYNEVVNGNLQADAGAIVAVLPSGNANDHHTAHTTGELISNIINGEVVNLEALKVQATIDGKQWVRYAHSYVGFGMTPKVGKVLTDKRPNALTEKWYVLRHLFDYKYVTLERDGRAYRYDNLICSVINRMSKVVKLDEAASTDDGLMEIYETEHATIIDFVKTFYQAATRGIRRSDQVHEVTLRTVKSTLIQLDGEVFALDPHSEVTITCKKDVLATVL